MSVRTLEEVGGRLHPDHGVDTTLAERVDHVVLHALEVPDGVAVEPLYLVGLPHGDGGRGDQPAAMGEGAGEVHEVPARVGRAAEDQQVGGPGAGVGGGALEASEHEAQAKDQDAVAQISPAGLEVPPRGGEVHGAGDGEGHEGRAS